MASTAASTAPSARTCTAARIAASKADSIVAGIAAVTAVFCSGNLVVLLDR